MFTILFILPINYFFLLKFIVIIMAMHIIAINFQAIMPMNFNFKTIIFNLF